MKSSKRSHKRVTECLEGISPLINDESVKVRAPLAMCRWFVIVCGTSRLILIIPVALNLPIAKQIVLPTCCFCTWSFTEVKFLPNFLPWSFYWSFYRVTSGAAATTFLQNKLDGVSCSFIPILTLGGINWGRLKISWFIFPTKRKSFVVISLSILLMSVSV